MTIVLLLEKYSVEWFLDTELNQMYINTVKFLLIPEQLIDLVKYRQQLTLTSLNVICKAMMANETLKSWWRHQMETFSALLAICAGNSPVPVNS